MLRKIAYNYKKEFNGLFGQVRDVIIVEATWLGRYEPFHKQEIASYIFEMMQKANQLEIAKEYNILPFEVQVLHVNRTICEKIMSLVRFSYGEYPIEDLGNKIRHTYDIHQLLSISEIKEFFHSVAFEEMLVLVAQDDVLSFKSNNKWLSNRPKQALIFKDSDTVWKELERVYKNNFSNLVYGELPESGEILKTLKMISVRLEDVNWPIKL